MKLSKTIGIGKTIFNMVRCLDCIACSFIDLDGHIALDCSPSGTRRSHDSEAAGLYPFDCLVPAA